MLSFMEKCQVSWRSRIHLAVCTYYQYNDHAGWSVTYQPGNTLSGMSVQSSWLHSWTDFFGGEHHAWKHSVGNVYIKLLTWNDIMLREES